MLLKTTDNETISLFKEVRHHGSDYLGESLDNKISLDELQRKEAFIRETLQGYFPQCNLESLDVKVFPQVFVL